MNQERALMQGSRGRDAIGKTAEERFEEIRRYFFEVLAAAGVSRRPEFFSRPKPGDSREPTEEEVVRRWAETLHISVNDICIGIQRGVMKAMDSGSMVTSFRYCVPHIIARCNELRDSRAGAFPTAAEMGLRPNPKALERIRAREEARRVLGGEKDV